MKFRAVEAGELLDADSNSAHSLIKAFTMYCVHGGSGWWAWLCFGNLGQCYAQGVARAFFASFPLLGKWSKPLENEPLCNVARKALHFLRRWREYGRQKKNTEIPRNCCFICLKLPSIKWKWNGVMLGCFQKPCPWGSFHLFLSPIIFRDFLKRLFFLEKLAHKMQKKEVHFIFIFCEVFGNIIL